MRIYISGAMTGRPKLNFPAFHAEAARLRALGHEVVNPAEINAGVDACWATCLKADIRALLDCDAIRMLEGWESSKGAQLEWRIATDLGLQVFYPHESLVAVVG